MEPGSRWWKGAGAGAGSKKGAGSGWGGGGGEVCRAWRARCSMQASRQGRPAAQLVQRQPWGRGESWPWGCLSSTRPGQVVVRGRWACTSMPMPVSLDQHTGELRGGEACATLQAMLSAATARRSWRMHKGAPWQAQIPWPHPLPQAPTSPGPDQQLSLSTCPPPPLPPGRVSGACPLWDPLPRRSRW